MAREIITHPAKNRHDSSCVGGTHLCGGPTVIDLTRRQNKSPPTRHATTPNATKSRLSPSPSTVGRPPRCSHLVISTTRARKAVAPYTCCHDLRTTLGTTLVKLVRSRVVAQLERWGCPILYSHVPIFPEKNEKLQDVNFRGRIGLAFPENNRENTEISGKYSKT